MFERQILFWWTAYFRPIYVGDVFKNLYSCETLSVGPLPWLLVKNFFWNASIFESFSRESFFTKNTCFIQSTCPTWRTSPSLADGDWVRVPPIFFVNNRPFVVQTITQFLRNGLSFFHTIGLILWHHSLTTIWNSNGISGHISSIKLFVHSFICSLISR